MDIESISSSMLDIFCAPFSTGEYEYRLHRIKLRNDRCGCGAYIYDGDREVYQAHASDEVSALRKAERWIDVQDESPISQDLH